jgi:glycosyltransferase involved in cell wall biosynthesis
VSAAQQIRAVAKHLLLIPFHFPPIQGSTGALRSLAFARWLPESNWRVTVLTVDTRAYPTIAADNEAMIPRDARVVRAFARDAQRHFSVRGRYPRVLAWPDRWSSWIVGGLSAGFRICRRDRPDVLYSTYPTPSSHVIAWLLHRLTGIPWVAEFRDPMVEENYPANATERRLRRFIEGRIFRHAARIVVVTESARALYTGRARRGPGFVVCIPNGYDDAPSVDAGPAVHQRKPTAPLTILHSGVLYPGERNPEPLLRALAALKRKGAFDRMLARFVFRGAGTEDHYRELTTRLGLDDLVEFRDAVSYSGAQEEMRTADALMVLQGSLCNRQIPAKVYEYLAAEKPVLCLADPRGDTGLLFRELGLPADAALEDVPAIEHAVDRFIVELKSGRAKVLDRDAISGMSRRSRARELVAVLDQVAGGELATDESQR